MEKIILIGGAAGRGTAKTSYMIAKAFVRMGYHVFNYRDYPSLITGGHNFNVLKISDKPVNSHENRYDIIIAFDQKTIDKHEKDLNENGFVVGDKNLKAKKLIGIDIKSVLEKLNAPAIVGNNIIIGCVFRLFGLPIEPVFEIIDMQFKEKASIIKDAIKEGYNAFEEKEKLGAYENKKRSNIRGVYK